MGADAPLAAALKLRSAYQLFVPAERFDELRRRDLASVEAQLRGEGKALAVDELVVGVPSYWVTAVGAAQFQPHTDLASIPTGDRTARALADRAEFRRSAAVGRTRIQWVEDHDLYVAVDSRDASLGLNDAFEFGATLEFSEQLTPESSR